MKSVPTAVAGPHSNPVDIFDCDLDYWPRDKNAVDLSATGSIKVWTPPAGAIGVYLFVTANADTLFNAGAFSADRLAAFGGDPAVVLADAPVRRLPASSSREIAFVFGPNRKFALSPVSGGFSAVIVNWMLGA